jgi:hypothetical protein
MDKRSERRSRKKNANPFKHAPLQGAGETFSWSAVNNVAAVNIPNNSANGSYVMEATCDVNGWAWNV